MIFILHLVRTSRLHVGYAVLWFIPLIMLILTVSFPPLLSFVTHAVGAIFPVSALTMLAFMFMFLVLVFMSVKLTTLSNRQIELIQHLALKEAENKEARAAFNETLNSLKILESARHRVERFSRERGNRLLLLQMLLRLVVLSLGGLHVWAAVVSHSMNEDGISYLDIGDAYFKGDWWAAVNSVWSPMYSWILGLVMRVAEPPMEWEFALVHVINFMIFVGALACFEFFWRQLTAYHRSQYGGNIFRWPSRAA
jgi:hypothetical protein